MPESTEFGKDAEYSIQQIPGTVHPNLDQDIIHITADRARLYLSEWRSKIEAQGSWIAPLSLGATLLLAILTADFKDRFGVPKEYWSAVFFVALLSTVIWLLRSLKRRVFNSAETTDEIVMKFMKGNQPPMPSGRLGQKRKPESDA